MFQMHLGNSVPADVIPRENMTNIFPLPHIGHEEDRRARNTENGTELFFYAFPPNFLHSFGTPNCIYLHSTAATSAIVWEFKTFLHLEE